MKKQAFAGKRAACLLACAALVLVGLVFFAAGMFFGMKRANVADKLLAEAGIEASYSSALSFAESGGINGDGISMAVYYEVNADELYSCVQSSGGWSSLPPSGALGCLLYGGEYNGTFCASVLADYDEVSIPAIDSGYVYFRDKQNIKNTYTDEEIIAVCGRPSANYTAALWDTETDKLYVIQYNS